MSGALRYIVQAGCPWRLLPNDLPPWEIVHQQATRWPEAGVYKAMVHVTGPAFLSQVES